MPLQSGFIPLSYSVELSGADFVIYFIIVRAFVVWESTLAERITVRFCLAGV